MRIEEPIYISDELIPNSQGCGCIRKGLVEIGGSVYIAQVYCP